MAWRDLTSPKNLWVAYRFRWQRRRVLARGFRKRRELVEVVNRVDEKPNDRVLLFSTMRNELARLPHFFEHYRSLGIGHFLIVDNGSDDGTRAYLEQQPDVSLWSADGSYREARFGADWLAWLLTKYGHGHWCLTVDADEILIYADWQNRPIQTVAKELEARGGAAMGALMVDLYPKGPLADQKLTPNPLDVLCWFDGQPHRTLRQTPMNNLWVQGGVRDRVFFSSHPERAPTLNKLPLVKWNRRYAYVNSTHAILPRRLNSAYDGPGDTRICGVLLHTKFMPNIIEKSQEELSRRQHFSDPGKYGDYYELMVENPNLWSTESMRYSGWEQFVELGIMSDHKAAVDGVSGHSKELLSASQRVL